MVGCVRIIQHAGHRRKHYQSHAARAVLQMLGRMLKSTENQLSRRILIDKALPSLTFQPVN